MARTVGSNASETRRRILDSAAEVFAEHGYSGASMRDIAERLGITKAALYYHFASKEDLLDGLVHPVIQSMADFAQEAEEGRYSAAQVLRGFLDLTVAGIPGLYPLMSDPGARTAIKARFNMQESIRRIEEVLAGGDDPVRKLCAQFALGGIRAFVLGRLFSAVRAACGPGDLPRAAALPMVVGSVTELVSDADCAVVVAAAEAGLGVGKSASVDCPV